ncbi:MAG: hypothetical protein FWE29_05700 [Defluviitaleaceae bacterium]|nr:hypothetical protein [Defluviitaleaceae bacterium]
MKKSILIILTFAILVLSLWGCSSADEYEISRDNKDDRNVTYTHIHARLDFSPRSLSEMESDSDVIVLARVLPGSVSVLSTIEGMLIPMGATHTEIEVIQVFEGDVVAGEILLIAEAYFTVETPYEIQVFIYENYLPSMPGQEYIFFLTGRENTTGPFDHNVIYNLSGFVKGRFPVLNELIPGYSLSRSDAQALSIIDFTDADLRLSPGDSRTYRALFEEVVERYFGEINR